MVTDLALSSGSYAVGPTGVLLADGTLQETPTLHLLVTDLLHADLEGRGWQESAFVLTSPLHPNLTISRFDLTGSFTVPPDEVIGRAEPINGVQVPPRELLSPQAAVIHRAWAEHMTEGDHAAVHSSPGGEGDSVWAAYREARRGPKRRPWRRWLLPAGACVAVVVAMLVAASMAGGIQHLLGNTTKVEAEVVDLGDGDRHCRKPRPGEEPWLITYGWSSEGTQHSGGREICTTSPPEIGDHETLWVNDDNDLVSTESPTIERFVAAGFFVGIIILVAIVVFRARRRQQTRRPSD